MKGIYSRGVERGSAIKFDAGDLMPETEGGRNVCLDGMGWDGREEHRDMKREGQGRSRSSRFRPPRQ